ncbi:MAG: HAD family hydrolase [Ruminococcus sp.]|nr:HAD family hydrolase [Ruminococcus sp.]
MKLTTILFDLDGTLLPMNNDDFTKGYFKLLVKKLAPYGYEQHELVDAIWKGTAAMVKNDGRLSNYDVFWKAFADTLGERVYETKSVFDDFYENEFEQAKALCGLNRKAAEAVKMLKERGYRVALASNPIFSITAQKARIMWAGVAPDEFELITSYENSAYCKPNPDYYTDIAKKLGVAPEECLMIGNDVDEDMIAETVGMSVFLLTDNIIDRENKDISAYPNGGFDDMLEYLRRI